MIQINQSLLFHVQVYGKQAELMAQSLSKGSPILLKEKLSNDLIMMNKVNVGRISLFPNQQGGITFLENRKHLTDVSRNNRAFSQPIPSSIPPSYPEPMDVESYSKGIESIQEHLCAFCYTKSYITYDITISLSLNKEFDIIP